MAKDKAKAAAKARQSGKGRGGVSSTTWGFIAVVGLATVVLLQWWLSASTPEASVPSQQAEQEAPLHPKQHRKKAPRRTAEEDEGGTDMSAVMKKMGMLGGEPVAALSGSGKHNSLEWQMLPRDLPACLTAQEELMTIPVDWPGFHAMCIESVDATTLTVRLHNRSGKQGKQGTRSLTVDSTAPSLVEGLIAALKEQLLPYEFQPADMISTSDYDFPPNPWRLHDRYMAVHGRFMAVSWPLHGRYMAASWPLHGRYMAVTWP